MSPALECVAWSSGPIIAWQAQGLLLLALLAKHKLRSITKPGREHEVFWASSETEKKRKEQPTVEAQKKLQWTKSIG